VNFDAVVRHLIALRAVLNSDLQEKKWQNELMEMNTLSPHEEEMTFEAEQFANGMLSIDHRLFEDSNTNIVSEQDCNKTEPGAHAISEVRTLCILLNCIFQLGRFQEKMITLEPVQSSTSDHSMSVLKTEVKNKVPKLVKQRLQQPLRPQKR
jgi:hypothetical protein